MVNDSVWSRKCPWSWQHTRTGRADRAQGAVPKALIKSGTKPKPFPVKSSVWN